MEDLYISGLRAECPPHCAWLPHESSPSVTLSPAVRPGGSGSCAGWSHCRAEDGCLRPPAASTQLLLRAEAWCCRSCTAEPGFKGEHILVPHSPMCLRWPSTGAGSYVEKKFFSLLTIGPHCFHQDRPLNVCFFNLTLFTYSLLAGPSLLCAGFPQLERAGFLLRCLLVAEHRLSGPWAQWL